MWIASKIAANLVQSCRCHSVLQSQICRFMQTRKVANIGTVFSAISFLLCAFFWLFNSTLQMRGEWLYYYLWEYCLTFHQCAIDGTHSPVITCVLLPRCELPSFDIVSLHRTNISFATSQRQRNRFNVLILKIIESRKNNRASRIREMMMKNEKQKRAN